MGRMAGDAARREADRLHRRIDQPVADRRLHSIAVHARHHGKIGARIRLYAHLLDPHFDGHFADGDADALRMAAGAKAQEAERVRHIVRERPRQGDRPLRAQPAPPCRSSLAFARRDPRDGCPHRGPLFDHPQGKSAAGRHRPSQRHDRGLGGRLLRRDGAVAEDGHGRAGQRSRRRQCRLLHRFE